MQDRRRPTGDRGRETGKKLFSVHDGNPPLAGSDGAGCHGTFIKLFLGIPQDRVWRFRLAILLGGELRIAIGD
jgi:hypothetical protein